MTTWLSDAIALSARKSGENDAILEVLTPQHGRVSGLVYGGAGKTKRALLEPGSRLHLAWKARNDDELGHFDTLEARSGGPAELMDDRAALAALSCAASLILASMPERSQGLALYEATEILLDALTHTPSWPALYIRWELGLLAELGYGLDLTKCALTGATQDLAWVSPKSGRAACREAGAPFSDKLLVLPTFLLDPENPTALGDIADGFALTGHFIAREIFDPMRKTMPDARARLIFALGKSGRL
jgi:DNA repair protein RecO (recombination protein O)